jgi:hypothetical protein
MGNNDNSYKRNLNGEEVDFPLANEDDETNTVIENECDNDY